MEKQKLDAGSLLEIAGLFIIMLGFFFGIESTGIGAFIVLCGVLVYLTKNRF
jgi:hypothetical protein